MKSPTTETLSSIKCYHCGEDCPKNFVIADEKKFCCDGCKAVYQILKDNGLDNYYHLNEAAGTSLKGKGLKKYEHLDQPDVVARLVQFSDEQGGRTLLELPQIHCTSCLWLLENLYKLDDQILQSRVNFLKKEVSIKFGSETSLRKIVELLDSLGYAPNLQLDVLDKTIDDDQRKSHLYKMGLAGFAFGNIMLLSFPEYLGLNHAVDGRFAHFFGLLNLLLALPVVFYSGFDYLRSAWWGLRQRKLNIDVPISLGILALFGRSAYEIITQIGAGYLDSLTGLIFFLLIGKWFQQKTYSKISFERDYKSYFPMATSVLIDDVEHVVTIDQLKPGDLIIIRHGELIPADSLVVDGRCEIDYSFVTGESESVFKDQGETVFAGGRQTSGVVHLRVLKSVQQSYLTSLWNEDIFQKEGQKGTVSRISDTVATYFTFVILIVAICTFIYWFPIDKTVAFQACTSVLIIACPCAVALAIPFTFGNVMRILGNHKFYLKNTSIIETAAGLTTIVFDKTGTITVPGNKKIQYDGSPLSPDEKNWIRSMAQQSAHPVSRQIDTYFSQSSILPVENFCSINGKGITGIVQGHSIAIGSAGLFALAPNSEGKSHETMISIDQKIKGSIIRQNRYRAGTKKVIKELGRYYDLALISGDNSKEENRLNHIFGDQTDLLFQQSPSEKLQYIEDLQSQGANVAMIGDGLNDAGALRQSDLGIVISETINNFIPACDAMLGAIGFRKLPAILAFMRQSIRLIYAAYGIALLYNITGLTFAVQGLLSPVIAAILMPLSSITIVLFGFVSSRWLGTRLLGSPLKS